VRDELPASVTHVESMSPTIVSDVGDIHTIEKPQRIVRKPNFLCRLCKGGHLTCLCPTIVVLEEVQSLSDNSSGSESSLVSQHSISPLIDTTTMSMQSSPDTTLVLRSEISFDHVINISNHVPSGEERVLLSPSTLPPSLREIPFD
jgi:hypothetical protein